MLRRITTSLLIFLPVLALLGVVTQAVSANVQQTIRPQERQLLRGVKTTIHNPFGRVLIQGWDRDVVQATATVEGAGGEFVATTIDEVPAGGLSVGPAPNEKQGRDIVLNVSLPRYAGIESISANGDIEIIGLDGPVEVKSKSGNVRISKVAGPANVSTESGNIKIDEVDSLQVKSQGGDVTLRNISGAVVVETKSGRFEARNIAGDLIVRVESGSVSLDNIAGQIDIALSSSNLKVHNAEGNIHAVTIGGSINLQCVQGNVEASTVNGPITLAGMGADVSARTTSGEIKLVTAIPDGGRYRLKSLSGSVHMSVASEALGFNATLSSYSGGIETEFPLMVGTTPARLVSSSRRLVGRYGDGRAQIELDSFSGSVTLNKIASEAYQTCPNKEK
jgi:DUF4097 and DUF4098 domain-containing protein YvlB